MDRRFLLAGAVVALVVLSGCSALPLWDDGPAPTPTPTETPAEDPPEADPSGEEGDGPEDVEYPAGWAPDGLNASETAIANHIETLSGYDNYFFRFDTEIRDGGEQQEAFVYFLSVDNENERASVVTDDGGVQRVAFYEGDSEYIRVDDGDEVRYDRNDWEFGATQFAGVQFVGPMVANVEYGDAEVVETDNGTFYRYVSEEVTNPSAVLRGEELDDEIASFEVSLVVHEDGSIREAGYVVETERGAEIRGIATVGGVGDVSIERPDWVDEAEEA